MLVHPRVTSWHKSTVPHKHRLDTVARHGRYHSTGQQLAWVFEGAFQLFLMPAASLSEGASQEAPPALGQMVILW